MARETYNYKYLKVDYDFIRNIFSSDGETHFTPLSREHVAEPNGMVVILDRDKCWAPHYLLDDFTVGTHDGIDLQLSKIYQDGMLKNLPIEDAKKYAHELSLREIEKAKNRVSELKQIVSERTTENTK